MSQQKDTGVLPVVLILFLIVIFTSANSIYAEGRLSGKGKMSLDLLIERAIKQNPEILAASKKIEALKQEVFQETTLEDPQLTITQWQIPSNFDVANPAQTWYGIGQSFPFPGKRALKGKIAEQEVDYQSQMLQGTIREIVLKVKTAYYQLFLAEKEISIHRDHQVLLGEFTQSAQQKYSAGIGTQQDIVKTEVELSKLHTSLLTLEEEKISAETTLNALLNLSPETPQEISEEPENTELKLTIEEMTPSILKTRPELIAANFQIEKKETTLSLAEKYIYPDFTGELTYMASYHGEANMWMAVAKINLPWIFNEKYKSKINQVQLEKESAEADRLQIQNQTLAEVRILYFKIKSLENSLSMYRNGILPQARQALESSRIAYRSGKTDLLNVIDSERTLKDLQMSYYETLVQYEGRINELEKMTGKDFN
ncbi:MAG: TolC family protein [Nitrospirae bacterium]|nr:TolC family protein [Nitrospirota bacterium]